MKNSPVKSSNKHFKPFQNNFLVLTLIALFLAIPAIVSAQCTLIINNPPAVCEPATVDITKAAITAGSDEGLTFSYWTNAGATVALTNPNAVSTSGTYYIKAVNAGGCNIIKPVTVAINPVVNPLFTAIGPLCQNSAATLPTTSVNGITGTWSPATISTSIAGTTNYTFTPDADLCATATSIAITINPPVTPSFTLIPPLCTGAAGPALPFISTNGITGTWNPATVNNTATGTYTFTPNAGQCATVTSLTVTVNPKVTPSFTPIPPLCAGAVSPILPTVSLNGISGTWSPAMVNNTATGTYTFTPAAGQCGFATTMTITINPTVTPNFTIIPPICQGSVGPILPPVSNNGIVGTWWPATISTALSGSSTYTFTPAAGQCALATSLTVTVTPNVAPTFAITPAICTGATAPILLLTSNNGITGTWNPATVSNTATGTYTFTPDAGLCSTVTSITMTINPPVTPSFTPIPPICTGSAGPTLPSTSTNGITGTWSPSTINTSVAGTTTYCFTPDTGQCAFATVLTITVGLTPAIDLGKDITACYGKTITLQANGGVGWRWSTGETTRAISLQVKQNLLIRVEVVSESGCRNADTVKIEVVQPFQDQQIAIVSVDTALLKNKVIWTPATAPGIRNFNIYREGDHANVFELIGTVDRTTTGYYIDDFSNPKEKSAIYKISVVDTCGNESDLSPFHKTLHLMGYMGANNAFNLIWNAYEGSSIDQYKIYRRNPASGFQSIGTVSGNNFSYSDLNPAQPESVYRVEAVTQNSPEMPGLTSWSNEVIMSSTSDYGISLFDKIQVYPNPNHGIFTFGYQSSEPGEVRFSVIDLTGRVLVDKMYRTDTKINELIRIPGHTPGILFIRLINDSGVTYRKIVVE